MKNDNLPPGCSVNDIPGNKPDDINWEVFIEKIEKDRARYALSIEDCVEIWARGLLETLLDDYDY